MSATTFQDALAAEGYVLPEPPIPDGRLHRFPHEDRNGGLAGWYVLHEDGIPAGSFGDWRSGRSFTWCSRERESLTAAEKDQVQRRLKQQRAAREAELARRRAKAAREAARRWKAARPADLGHPYLKRKGVQAHGLRQEGELLLVPAVNTAGELMSLQTIDGEGRKLFLPGGQKRGAFHRIKGAGATTYICEGFATGATIHEATGAQVVVAFDAGNLEPVAKALRQQDPGGILVIAADDDRFTDGNPGQTKAAAAAQAVNATIVSPRFKDLATKLTDFNDLASMEGLEAVRDQLEEAAERRAIQDEGAPEPAQQGAPAEAPSPWENPVDLAALLDAEPPDQNWLIDERMPAGRAVLICGIGGSSKTRILYQLAVGIVLGSLPWDWTVRKTGRALLVLTEDTAEDVHRTAHVICRTLSKEERLRVYSSIICYPLAGKPCTLLEKAPNGGMVETDLFRSLEKKIQELEDVVLVGLDPALSITTGDENDQGHQRALGRMADNLAVRTCATVVLLSHAAKASASRDELESHNSRGGGAITDAVRAEYAMRTMTAAEAKKAGIEDIEERKRHVQLAATKGNHLPAAAYVPIWLRRDNGGTLSQVEVEFDAADTRGPGKKDLLALGVLTELSACATPSLQEWKTECVRRGVITGATPDAQKKAMQRSLKKLATAGLIRQGIGRGIWRPEVQ